MTQAYFYEAVRTPCCKGRPNGPLHPLSPVEVSAHVLHFMEQTGFEHSKVNVNGCAIAMGHPIGATGPILVNTVLDELERSGGGVGSTTLCAGLGHGVATVIERAAA